MAGFFPPGFWKMTATIGMAVFLVLGFDLLLGARLMTFLSKTMNRKFSVDQLVVRALAELKKNSDKEFDVEHVLLHGWGRLMVSGALLVGAFLMGMFLIPRLG